jgi:hypothetical protein
MKIHLIVKTDENLRETGLYIKGTEHNERLNAATHMSLIAHDVVEHFGQPQGTAENEFEAIGATQFVRAPWEPIRLESDISSVWEDMESYGDTLPELSDLECEEREIFTEMVEKTHDMVDENLKRLTVNLLCNGYNKAQQQHKSSIDAYDLYQTIARTPYPEIDFEGQQFILTVDTNQNTAFIKEISYAC